MQTIFLSPYKVGFLLILISAGGFWACDKVDELLTFKIKNEANFEIPSLAGVDTPFSVPTPDVSTNSSQTFATNNTDVSKVKDIKLDKLTLAITAPSNATFSRFKSVKIYISAEGLGEKLLASKENISTIVGTTLMLDATGEKLDDYIKKDKFNLKMEVVTREAVFYTTKINAKMTFSVTAKL
jgi:hypothetical protein